MSLLSSHIEKMFVVYTTVQDLLQARGYPINRFITTFDEFKHRFVKHTTICREDLDMQFDDLSGHGSVFVIFLTSPEKKAISVQQIRTIVERLASHTVSNCILIHEQPLSTGAKKELEKIDGIEPFEECQLLFNVHQHKIVPPYRKLNVSEKAKLMEKYKLRDHMLPLLQKNDPMARFLGLRRGNVVEIVRPSETAGEYTSYRVCV